jgi:hypothetical protein
MGVGGRRGGGGRTENGCGRIGGIVRGKRMDECGMIEGCKWEDGGMGVGGWSFPWFGQGPDSNSALQH